MSGRPPWRESAFVPDFNVKKRMPGLVTGATLTRLATLENTVSRSSQTLGASR